VWAGAILIAIGSARRRAAVRELALFALVVTPWLWFANAYYGSPMPQSVVAKGILMGGGGLKHFIRPGTLRDYATELAGWMPFAPNGGFSPFEFALGLGLVAFGAWRLRTGVGRPAAWVLLAFPLTFAFAEYVGRAPRAFPWYGVPVTWACLVLLAVGMDSVWEAWQAGRREGAGPLSSRPARMAALALTGWLGLAWTYEHATREVIGRWLDAHAARQATVAMEAIGYQGVYSHRRVIDLAGLITPRVTELRRAGRSYAEVYRRLFEEMRPDFIVFRSFEVDQNRNRDGGPLFETAASESTFKQRYAEVLRVHAPYAERWGEGSDLTVYARISPRLEPGPAPSDRSLAGQAQ
jgi:hypothetical protein